MTDPYVAEIIQSSRRPDQKYEYDRENYHEDTGKF